MCLMRARRRALKLQRLIGCSNVAYEQRCLRVNGVPRRFTTAANACLVQNESSLQEQQSDGEQASMEGTHLSRHASTRRTAATTAPY